MSTGARPEACVPFLFLHLLLLATACSLACRRSEGPPQVTLPASTPAPIATSAPAPAAETSPAPVHRPETESRDVFPLQHPGGNVSQPRLTVHQNPPIPLRCYPLTVQGPEPSFVFEVGVDEKGTVCGVRTATAPSFSPPCPEFEPVWHAAIRQWRYAPALREGRPVAVTVRVSIDFK